MKKSRFLTFCFAFVPGAGHMYHNYMKRGISFMGLFALSIALASSISWVMVTVTIPIIWCVAFFDTFHTAYRDAEARAAKPDAWLWNEMEGFDALRIDPNKHKVVGTVLILGGIWLLFDRLPYILNDLGVSFMWPVYRFFRDNAPGVAAAVLLIWLGVRFVRGPKTEPVQSFYTPAQPEQEVQEDGE